MKKLFTTLIATLLILVSTKLLGACSAYKSFATINEAGKVGFVEIKLLDPNIPSSVYSTWNIRICEGQKNQCTGQLSLAGTPLINNVYLPRQTNFVPNNQPFDIILTDGNGDTIDYFSVAYTPQQDTSCSPAFDWTSPISSSHDYHRMPDGTGEWSAEPGNSGGDSEGDTNQPGLPTLTVGNIVVNRGQPATFTLTMSEASTSDVTLFYQSVDDSALAGTHYTAQSGTFVIPAGALTATLSIQTTAGSPGGDVDFFLFIYNADNASIVNHYPRATILASSLDHFTLIHDGSGINCLREAIVIRAEDQSGGLVTDYIGTVSLTTLTSNGNWFVTDSTGASTDPALGTLVDSAGDNDGQASYTFDVNDNGQVVLYLENTVAETTNIQVSDGSVIDDNSEGDITFRPVGFTFTPSPIATQVAGKPFQVSLSAAGQTPSQPNCGVIEEYTGSKSLNFWSQYAIPSSSPTNVIVNGVSISQSEVTTNTQNVVFNNGTTSLTVIYNDVGTISIQAKDEFDIGDPPAGSLNEIIGGIVPFVVRPFAYDVQVPLSGYADDGNDPVFTSAGSDFSTTLRSVLWDINDDQIINATGVAGSDGIPDPAQDTNGDGIPDSGANLADNGITPNIVQLSQTISLSPLALYFFNSQGTLSTTSVAMSDFGAINSATQGTVDLNMSWSEVGILQINAATNDFLNGGEAVTGLRTNIGRFIPDRFDLTIDPIVEQCGTFTYGGFFDGTNPGLNKAGQPFNISGNIQALNAQGIVTENYENIFAKLTNSDFSALTFNTLTGSADLGIINLNPSALIFNAGISTYSDLTAHYQFESLQGPKTLRIDLSATDSDNVSSGIVASTEFDTWQGRLKLEDSYGPEVTDLEMRIVAEYFDGTDWLRNLEDNCSTYIQTEASFDATSYTDNLSAGETSIFAPNTAQTLNNGVSNIGNGIWFTAPGENNFGSVTIEFSPSTQPWLLFDWSGDNNLNANSATLNFGYYRGSDRMIYWREL